MEEKKNKVKKETKETTKKKVDTKKKTNTSTKKKAESAAKKSSSKTVKATSKKANTTTKNKKVTPASKKVTPKVKEIEKKAELELKVDKVEENLEKTIIFDGNQSKNILEVVDKLEEENIVLDDKIVKRSKTNKIVIAVLIGLIIAVIFGTIYYVYDANKTNKENSQTINSDIYKKANKNYKSLSDIKENDTTANDNDEYENIENISLTDFEKKAYNKENMTVFISSTTCYHSITFESVIDEVYGELDMKMYRINISEMSDEEVNKFRTYYAFTVTPTIFVVKDGVVVAENTGTMTNEELTEWVKENAM